MASRTPFTSSSMHRLICLDAEDDLISFTSFEEANPSTTPQLSVEVPNIMSDSRPKPEQRDSFADLAPLLRAKKPWTMPAPQPGGNGLNSRQNDNFQSLPGSRVQSVDSFLRENGPSVPQPAQIGQRQPMPVEQRRGFSGSTTLGGSEYDEGDMRRLEDIMAQVNVDDTEDTPAPESEFRPSQSTTPHHFYDVDYLDHEQDDENQFTSPAHESRRPFEDEPVVRCTQTVWDALVAQTAALKKDKMDALEQLAALRRDLNKHSDCERQVGSTIGKLHYQLEANKDYKAAMGRVIREKDMELYKKEMEIDGLTTKVADMEALQKALDESNAELKFLRTNKTSEEDAHRRILAQVTASKEKENADLKAATAHSKATMSDHATRAQNLVDTQNKREKKMTQLQNELDLERDLTAKLRDQLDALKEGLPSQKELEDLRQELAKQRATSDRQRNELRVMERRLDLSNKSFQKVESGIAHLRGAAHLIIPNTATRLAKNVFPCMECFVANKDCDSKSRCYNCTLNDVPCARWRCSMKHILQECKEMPCKFLHDNNGWLVTREQRPQW